MTVAKRCSVCGVTFWNKSNLNRHTKHFHVNKVKTISTNKQVFIVSPKKTSRSNTINIQALNEVLWGLLLQIFQCKRGGLGLDQVEL